MKNLLIIKIVICLLLSIPLYSKAADDHEDEDSVDAFFELTSSTTTSSLEEHEKEHDRHDKVQQLKKFFKHNHHNIVKHIAQGNGETLITIAQILELDDLKVLNVTLNNNFDAIYTCSNISTDMLAMNVIKVSLESKVK